MPIFILLNLLFMGIMTLLKANYWIPLSLFCFLDILILYLLPKLLISFGPIQPQALTLLILRWPFIFLPYPLNIIFQIIGTLLVIYGYAYEPAQVVISKKAISSGKSGSITKIVHIGDIHLEKLGRREEKILHFLQESSPDLILFSGDFLNISYRSAPEAIKEISNFFTELNEIAQTFFVSGSPAVDLEETLTAIQEMTDAVWLSNKSIVTANNIEIIGLNCTHNPHKDINSFNAIVRQHKPTFCILLHHSPDLIFELHNQHIDLMLSGHTHGGQVRLPIIGALFTGSLYGRKLQAGQYKYKNSALYITRGLGLEGLGAPRVRFLCKPEIIEWTIKH